jgi:hypothetical protein
MRFFFSIEPDGTGGAASCGSQAINNSLLYLLPYSSGLNPAGKIWQFPRQNHLSNRVFKSYNDILDACCSAWNAFVGEKDRIASIATRDWAPVIA